MEFLQNMILFGFFGLFDFAGMAYWCVFLFAAVIEPLMNTKELR